MNKKICSRSILLSPARLSVGVAFVALSLIGPLAPSAFAKSDLMSGMKAYQAKDYQTARTYFQRAIQSAPEDSLAHYYLGNTLLKLKDTTGAKKEYQAGSTSAETDDVKANCDKAVEALQKNDKTQTVKAGPAIGSEATTASTSIPSLTPGGTTAGGGAPGGAGALSGGGNVGGAVNGKGASGSLGTGAPAGAASALPGVDTAPEIPLTPLQKHAQMEKNLIKQESDAAQKQLLDNAAAHAKSIEENTKRATDTSDMNYRARARAQAYINDLKQQGEKQRSQALDYGKTRAAAYQKLQEDRAKSIDEVVNNLNDQMNSKVGASKVHLKPEGTSIYVRNYGQ